MNHEEFTPEQLLEQHRQGMMEDLNEGYEQYKKNHPKFAKEADQFERKRNEWPQTVKKVIPKPKVKYKQSSGYFCGEKYTHRYKLTLLATVRGQEARALIAAQQTGEGQVFSYDPKSMDKVEIYHEQMLPSKSKSKRK
jgi:hypothetical protein